MSLLLGCHVSFKSSDQLLGSVKEALSYGANTFMFYTGAPQNTRRGEINDVITLEAQEVMRENKIDLSKVIVHAPYIVNLANEVNFDFSVEFLRGDIERCAKLGISAMVLHPGSAVGVSREEAIKKIGEGLNLILDNDYEVKILLETMAGKGNEVGRSFEELAEIISLVKFPSKIGVCMDTCHIHDAGYDLENFDGVLEEFDRIVGLAKLECVHVNDSKNDKGSHKDRHENLGFGKIGFENLLKVIYHKDLTLIPKILETPYVTWEDNAKERLFAPYKREIRMIKDGRFNERLIEEIREENKR